MKYLVCSAAAATCVLSAAAQPANLVVDDQQSSIALTVTLDTAVGARTDSDESPISGTISIELDSYSSPTTITVVEYDLAAGALSFFFDYSFLGTITASTKSLSLPTPPPPARCPPAAPCSPTAPSSSRMCQTKPAGHQRHRHGCRGLDDQRHGARSLNADPRPGVAFWNGGYRHRRDHPRDRLATGEFRDRPRHRNGRRTDRQRRGRGDRGCARKRMRGGHQSRWGPDPRRFLGLDRGFQRERARMRPERRRSLHASRLLRLDRKLQPGVQRVITLCSRPNHCQIRISGQSGSEAEISPYHSPAASPPTGISVASIWPSGPINVFRTSGRPDVPLQHPRVLVRAA